MLGIKMLTFFLKCNEIALVQSEPITFHTERQLFRSVIFASRQISGQTSSSQLVVSSSERINSSVPRSGEHRADSSLLCGQPFGSQNRSPIPQL